MKKKQTAETGERYIEQMLTVLVERYRKSKKDSGETVIRRRTMIRPDRLYPAYYSNAADIGEIEAVHAAVKFCEEKGFAACERERFGSEIRRIWLLDDGVDAAEAFLGSVYGYVPRAAKLERLAALAEQYSGLSPVLDAECARLKQLVIAKKVPAGLQETEDILRALAFVEHNQKLLYIREASMLLYGSSKYFEAHTLDRVCAILRRERKAPCGEDELPDEILERYHIFREQPAVRFRGNCTLTMSDGAVVPLAGLRDGIEIGTDVLDTVVRIAVHAEHLITVENKTSYLRMRNADACIVYLGGFADRLQRDFLIRVARDNPGLKWLHFGDIDAGGLLIHAHLCRVTGIAFALYRMSERELTDPAYQSCLQPLTPGDVRRLVQLRETEPYQQVVSCMLERGVKLEQEIISLMQESRKQGLFPELS